MPSATLRHVFISYARAGSDFVAQLIHDLEERGIGNWVDKCAIVSDKLLLPHRRRIRIVLSASL